MAYTPGVARICNAIHEDPRASHTLTIRKNCIAVVSDGSAVLGLGNIGAAAAMPVMERAAAHAIAATISDEELSPDYVIPSVFNRRVGKQVGRAVARAARESGIARRVHKSSGIPE